MGGTTLRGEGYPTLGVSALRRARISRLLADPMPRDHERNYGFTQFALELNELTPELRRVLPSTDTRLRPDQR